jgi:phospholipid transport system transporter-binding protein
MSAVTTGTPTATAATGALRDAGGGRFKLEGAVTMATVMNLRSAGLRAFGQSSGAIDVDLSGVGRADSGGLALLIDWLAWARAAHRVLKYSSPPEALLALARLSDVEELLVGAGA